MHPVLAPQQDQGLYKWDLKNTFSQCMLELRHYGGAYLLQEGLFFERSMIVLVLPWCYCPIYSVIATMVSYMPGQTVIW